MPEIDKRIPPSDIDAERAVLSAMLYSNQTIGSVNLQATDYYEEAHQLLHIAALELYSAGEPVDILTLNAHLKKGGLIADVGGATYIARINSEVATSANITHHAQIVKRAAQARAGIVLARALEEGSYEDFPVAAEVASAELLGLMGGDDGSVSSDLFGILDEVLEEFQREGTDAITTGLPDYDKKLSGGFAPGTLNVIGARPSVGKTALGVGIAYGALCAGSSVGFITMEMTGREVGQRLISMGAGLDLVAIREKTASLEELINAQKRIANYPLYVEDMPSASLAQIRSKATHLKRHRKIDLLVIDYLQLIEGPGESRNERVGAVSRGLKALAKSLHIPIVALAQLSRAVESRADRRPQLSDLRDSGEIEQDCDTVTMIYRPGYYDHMTQDFGNAAFLLLEKHRNGPTGVIETVWMPEVAQYCGISYRQNTAQQPF